MSLNVSFDHISISRYFVTKMSLFPDFHLAMGGDKAKDFYEEFLKQLRERDWSMSILVVSLYPIFPATLYII